MITGQASSRAYAETLGAPAFLLDPRIRCNPDNAGLFFPGPKREETPVRLAREELAKAICRGCPLRPDCAAWALGTRQEFGVAGALSEEDRRAIWNADATLPCPSDSARRRHLAQGRTCETCGVGYEPLPVLERAEAA